MKDVVVTIKYFDKDTQVVRVSEAQYINMLESLNVGVEAHIISSYSVKEIV